LKNFLGVVPRTSVKGKGRKDRTEGVRRGLGTQMGRMGMVSGREGGEGMRGIQRKGWEWRKGEGKRRKEGGMR
jgi:hypothetical protein